MTSAIERLETVNPDALRLAEVVSLAVIVDRALLRAARLELLPAADAGAEADLWLSGIVQSRSVDGIVFDPKIAEELRARLEPAMAKRVWDVIRREHAWLEPSLRLEEEIAFLSVSRDPAASEQLAQRLRCVLAAMVQGGRDGVARWAARAMSMFPSGVRDLPEAKMLDAGTRLRLGQAPQIPDDQPMPEWLPWIMPEEKGTVPLSLQLREGQLEIGAETGDADTKLDVPATDPLLLEVSWEEGHIRKTRQVIVRRGERVTVGVGHHRLRLRTIAGAEYEICDENALSVLRDAVIDFRDVFERPIDTSRFERQLTALVAEIVSTTVGQGRLLTVIGPQGSGKTVLMAALAKRLRGLLPCFHHFFGASDPRASWVSAAQRSLAAQIALEFDIPARTDVTLENVLDDVRARSEPEMRIVILLDRIADEDDLRLLLPADRGLMTVVASSRKSLDDADFTISLADPDVAETNVRTVRVGVLSPISRIDPREAVDNISSLILGEVYERPYEVYAQPFASGEAEVRPNLFEPLRAEAPLRYSAAVREGIRFSDGTPLTAELAARALRGNRFLRSKADVDWSGDRVLFELTAPNPRFDLTLTQSNCAIVLDRGVQLLGTGAFMFDQQPNLRLLQAAKRIRLVRNPHYRGSTDLEEIHFVVHPADDDGTPSRMIEALRDGTIDLTTALTYSDITKHGLHRVVPALQAGSSTGILFFNTERRVLSLSTVRRGLALALDVMEIAAHTYDKNSSAFVARSLLPPMMGRATGIPPYSRAESMRLLEASGAKPTRLSMLVPWAPRPYLPKPLVAARVIQRQLAEIGVTVELRETKTADEFFSDLSRGNFDLALAGWIADTPDPADFFEALLWSQMGEIANPSRWKNQEVDDALLRFRESPTEENKQTIQRLIRDEAPLVPLLYGQSVVAHSRGLRNVFTDATGSLKLAGIKPK